MVLNVKYVIQIYCIIVFMEMGYVVAETRYM